jgi:hypothetical protein
MHPEHGHPSPYAHELVKEIDSPFVYSICSEICAFQDESGDTFQSGFERIICFLNPATIIEQTLGAQNGDQLFSLKGETEGETHEYLNEQTNQFKTESRASRVGNGGRM